MVGGRGVGEGGGGHALHLIVVRGTSRRKQNVTVTKTANGLTSAERTMLFLYLFFSPPSFSC